jgi:hypothetical protein
MFLSTGNGMLDGVDPDDLTHANVMNGNVKYKTLRKNKLQVLCGNLLDHIKYLEVEKDKAELRLEEELKEAKVEEAVFDDNGTGTTSNGEDDVKGVEEGDVNVNNVNNNAKLDKLAKSAKLAKLVERAKSTDLWCLLQHVPLEVKDKEKQRKVCPVNLRGEFCTDDSCGSKHPQVCLLADHSKGKIPKSTCMLWHMRIPRENPTGNISNNNARPAKLDDKYFARLEAECWAEELKARIRATKLMSQDITYSQMVEGPPHQVPAQSHRANCHSPGYRQAAETITSSVV